MSTTGPASRVETTARLRRFAGEDDSRMRALARAFAGALVTSIGALASVLALASIVFGEGLEDVRAAGFGYYLAGAVVMGLVGLWASGLDGVVVGPQDAVATVLAVAVGSLATGGADPLGDSVIALVIVTTVGSGLVLYLLGRFGLGRLIRFLPFPVMAGFLGGVGLVLADSAVDLLTGGFDSDDLLGFDAVMVWAPAALVATLLLWLGRTGHFGNLALPAVLVASLLGFNLARFVAGIDRADAIERGWLISSLPTGRLLHLDALAALPGADWAAVAAQVGTVATLVVLVPVSVLLHTGAFEQTLGVDLDADRELRAAGAANLAGALVGSGAGYSKFASTVLSRRVAGGSAAPPLGVVAAAGATILLGDHLVSLIPLWVLGGLLLSIAVEFIDSWLYRVRKRVDVVTWLTILAIAAIIIFLGFLEGIVAGLILTTVTFIVNYARIPTVRSGLTLAHRRSNVQRSVAEDEVLSTYGDRVLVLELHGYVFFGSAEGVLDPVRKRLAETDPPLEAVVIDFRRTTGVDSSAHGSFLKLARIARDNDIELVFSSMSPVDHARLVARSREEGVTVPVDYSDLDYALEAGERSLLRRHEDDLGHGGGFEQAFGAAAEDLRPFFSRRSVAKADEILVQGEPSPGLIVLDEGSASVYIRGNGGTFVRRRRLRAGALVGDITAYLGGHCTATVQMDDAGWILVLSPEARADLERDHPEVAIQLHTAMARTLAERLTYSNSVIEQLLS